MHFHWVGETSDKFALCRCDGCRLEPSPGFPPLKTTEWKRPQWKNKMCRCFCFWFCEGKRIVIQLLVFYFEMTRSVSVASLWVHGAQQMLMLHVLRLPHSLKSPLSAMKAVIISSPYADSKPLRGLFCIILKSDGSDSFHHNDKHTVKHSHQHADTVC